MKVRSRTPLQTLAPAYRKEKVSREAIDRLRAELPKLLDRTANAAESEENHKGHFQTFLREGWYRAADCLIAPKGRIDLVIHDGPKAKDAAGVLIEAKRGANTAEMFHPERPNCKALRELVLYFLRERQAGNTGVKTLMITDVDAVYLFADREFDRLFWEKKRFRDSVLAADQDKGKTNATAYEIIGRHLDDLDDTLECTALHLSLYRTYCEDGDPATDEKLLPLYKILSPVHLLRRPFAGDSNHLDKGFYRELLHIIGLHEVNKKNGKIVKAGGKKVIERLPEGQRHPASLLENTLQVAAKENRFRHVSGWRDYGHDEEDRRFGVALELCLTWVNRILFLKLLETQLSSYHQGDKAYRFLSSERIPDFDALNTLFFDVLNKPVAERESIVADFARVPYLNSSLFEISALEDQVLRVNSLKDQFALPLAPSSVLRTRGRAPEPLPPLAYLFQFLDAYDFGGEGKASIQEDNKRLINASVLGLIFEKINGYRDGSFYTPGFITEYMCRQTIRRAVVQKFRDDPTDFADFDADDFEALRNYLRRDNYKPAVRTAANALVNSLTVCDPAVGSGHFLVSALNEIIATKSELGILGADAGAKELDVRAVVENDELLVHYRRDGEPYEYRVETTANGQIRVMPEVQTVQQTLFEEKRTLIENCLFGVDLNPNSVKICRLRLWIELLKNAYYRTNDARPPRREEGADSSAEESGRAQLETLPNIDINIKQGNSLISRFALDDDLSDALNNSDLTLADYRRAVTDYHRAQGRDSKERLLTLIDSIKQNFQTHIGRNDKRVKALATARGQVQKLESLLEMGDLFGSVDEKKVRQEMAPLQKKVDKLEAELAAVRDNAIYEQAFEWRFEFPAVLGEDGRFVGFDVVVGNPPYLGGRDWKLSKNEFNYYLEKYPSAEYQFDAYVLFFDLGIRLSRSFLGYITPNTWLNNQKTKKLRRNILLKDVLVIADYSKVDVFSEASVLPIILILANSNNTNGLVEIHRPLTDITAGVYVYSELNQSVWYDDDLFIFNIDTTSEEALVRDKISLGSRPLDTFAKVKFGIKLYEKGKGIPPQKSTDSRDHVFESDEKLDQSYRPYLTGKNIETYEVKWNSKWLKYGSNLAAPRTPDLFEDKRIVVRRIVGKRLISTMIEGDYVTSQMLQIVKPNNQKEAEEILAILNSKLMIFYFQKKYNRQDKTFPEIRLYELSNLPIKLSSSSKLTSLVTRILHQKSQSPTADTSALEAEIDVLVYKLYGLTYAEVLVVDGAFGMAEGAYDAVGIT